MLYNLNITTVRTDAVTESMQQTCSHVRHALWWQKTFWRTQRNQLCWYSDVSRFTIKCDTYSKHNYM